MCIPGDEGQPTAADLRNACQNPNLRMEEPQSPWIAEGPLLTRSQSGSLSPPAPTYSPLLLNVLKVRTISLSSVPPLSQPFL